MHNKYELRKKRLFSKNAVKFLNSLFLLPLFCLLYLFFAPHF